MLTDNDRISSWQMTVILVCVMNSTGLLKMPRTLGEQVGPDGWMSLIIGHALALVMILVMVWLGQRFAGSTFIEYSQQIIGRVPGWLVGLTAVVYWIVAAARIMRVFSDIVKLFVLPRTPVELIIITILLLSNYLARHGIEPLARMMEILFYLVVGLILGLALLSIPTMDLTNLQPIFATSFRTILAGGLRTGARELEGIGVFLMLLPFMLRPERAATVGTIGMGINLALHLVIFTTTISVFGIHALDLTWPVALLAQYAVVPGALVEHMEILFILVWITVAYTSIVIYIYLASLGLSRLFKMGEPSVLICPILPIIYFIALIPANVFTVENLESLEKHLYIVVAWGFPSVLLLIAWIRSTFTSQTPRGG